MATLKVLLVEDDNSLRETLKEAISNAGHTVLTARDGVEATALLDGDLPDAMVTDVLLPKLSGLELLGALRQKPGGEQVQIIMMSGIYRGARHRRNAKEKYGVEVYLQKPFDLQVLLLQLDALTGPCKKSASPNDLLPQSTPLLQKEILDDELASASALAESDAVEKASVAFQNPLALSSTKIPNRGTFLQTPFPELLAQLYREQVSGALMVKHGRGKKIIYFAKGMPTFVKSNLLSECLGRILVQERLISEEECKLSLQKLEECKAKGQPKPQGELLIEMNILSQKNLVYGLTCQLEAKLFDIFAWGNGRFQFSENIENTQQNIQLDLTLANILLEGIRRHFSDGLLQQLLAPYASQKLQMHSEPLFDLNTLALEADERMFISAVDGNRTASQLAELGLLESPEARVLLYTLLAGQMVQRVSPLKKQPSTQAYFAQKTATQPSSSRKTPPALSRPHALSPKKEAHKAPPSRKTPPPRPAKAAASPATDFAGKDTKSLRKILSTRLQKAESESALERLRVFNNELSPPAHNLAVEVDRAFQSDLAALNSEAIRTAPSDVRAMAKNLKQLLEDAYEELSTTSSSTSIFNRAKKNKLKENTNSTLKMLAASQCFLKGQERLQQSVGLGNEFDAPVLDKNALQEAEKSFAEALLQSADDGEIQSHLAWAQYRQQELHNIKAAQKPTESSPNASSEDKPIAPDVPEQEAPADALLNAVKCCPNEEFPQLFLAAALQANGKLQDAQKTLQYALLQHPNSPRIQSRLQMLAQELGRLR